MTIKLPPLDLTPARLELRKGLPYSRQFEDGYHGSENVAGESEHVFLDGNDLPSRWRTREQFCIGELGFGTGLNFALTRMRWREHRRGSQRLHYLAVEAFPFDRRDLQRLITARPEAAAGYAGLVDRWPDLVAGPHRRSWPAEGVFLTLLYGDGLAQLQQQVASIDAWYLDGFAPSRNPSMWNEPMLREVARLSAPRATAATFSAATQFRATLKRVGFSVEKRPGFGTKREMTVARLTGDRRDSRLPRWARLRAPRPRSIIVVGAGIAGASTAYAASSRGIDVQVLESSSSVASGASGVGSALVGPRLPMRQSLEETLGLRSLAVRGVALSSKQRRADRWAPTLDRGSREASKNRDRLAARPGSRPDRHAIAGV